MVAGGACVVARGACVVARGCVWLLRGGRVWLLWGGCVWLLRGGMCGCLGACVVALGWHAWLLRGGGMHGCSWGPCMVTLGGACVVALGGHAWLLRGVCMVARGGGMHGFFSFFRYNEIRSMSGRYASYWNAFLFTIMHPFIPT